MSNKMLIFLKLESNKRNILTNNSINQLLIIIETLKSNN